MKKKPLPIKKILSLIMNNTTELLKSQYNVYSQEKFRNFDNGN